MVEPKWAPTPWDFEWISAPASGGGHLYIVDSTGRKIAAIWGKAAEKESAARLIAAAPDLYEALLYVAEHIADKARGPRDLYPVFGLNARRAIEQTAAALAKARGETP